MSATNLLSTLKVKNSSNGGKWFHTSFISLKNVFIPLIVFQPNNAQFEGWAQDYSHSNIFLKPLFRGNLDPFVNNANLGAIAHTSNGT